MTWALIAFGGLVWLMFIVGVAYVHGRQVKFLLEIPKPSDFPKKHPKTGHKVDQAKKAQDEERRRWRALALCIKAKLEAGEMPALMLPPAGR